MSFGENNPAPPTLDHVIGQRRVSGGPKVSGISRFESAVNWPV
jgi:hypothetical protein